MILGRLCVHPNYPSNHHLQIIRTKLCQLRITIQRYTNMNRTCKLRHKPVGFSQRSIPFVKYDCCYLYSALMSVFKDAGPGTLFPFNFLSGKKTKRRNIERGAACHTSHESWESRIRAFLIVSPVGFRGSENPMSRLFLAEVTYSLSKITNFPTLPRYLF